MTTKRQQEWRGKLEADNRRLQEHNAQLRTALEPFKDWLDHIEATGSRRLEDNESPVVSGWPSMGELRKVRAALKAADGEGE